MRKIFNNILLPVNVNRKTVAEVEKAIAFANRLGSNLHVLYLSSPVFPLNRPVYQTKSMIASWQRNFRDQLDRGLLLETSLAKGELAREVKSYLLGHDIDLVCMAEHYHHHFSLANLLDPSWLSTEANCAVISNRTVDGFRNWEKIVLPVGYTLPLNSIRVAAYLAQEFKASIHMVSLAIEEQDAISNLSRAYHLLKENTELDVVLQPNISGNERDGIFRYAESIQAGLVIMNVEKKDSRQGLLARLFSRGKSPGKFPVMMVE